MPTLQQTEGVELHCLLCVWGAVCVCAWCVAVSYRMKLLSLPSATSRSASLFFGSLDSRHSSHALWLTLTTSTQHSVKPTPPTTCTTVFHCLVSDRVVLCRKSNTHIIYTTDNGLRHLQVRIVALSALQESRNCCLALNVRAQRTRNSLAFPKKLFHKSRSKLDIA